MRDRRDKQKIRMAIQGAESNTRVANEFTCSQLVMVLCIEEIPFWKLSERPLTIVWDLNFRPPDLDHFRVI